MPYKYKKVGDKYAVYKKDTGKLVGKTKGDIESLHKYLAALHLNAESISHIKLTSLMNEALAENESEKMSSEEKKAFMEAVSKFTQHSNNIYRTHSIKETAKSLGELINAASKLTLSETEDWFDNVTVNRHMKHLSEAHKIFEKTANEIETLQQRLEAAYDDIGETLGKYYNINEIVEGINEAVDSDYTKANNFHKFFHKALKKFKITSPADLESEKQRKRFFNWIDANYKANDETSKSNTESNE